MHTYHVNTMTKVWVIYITHNIVGEAGGRSKIHKEKYFHMDNNPPFILIHLILSVSLEKKAENRNNFKLFKYHERSPELISTTIWLSHLKRHSSPGVGGRERHSKPRVVNWWVEYWLGLVYQSLWPFSWYDTNCNRVFSSFLCLCFRVIIFK